MLAEKHVKRSIVFYAFLTCCLFVLAVSPPSTMAGNERTVALVMKALSNPFFIKMKEGAQAYAAREKIPLEVFGVERETDVEKQIGIMESLISRGYGAIVLAPADSIKLVPVCKKALENGITVIDGGCPLMFLEIGHKCMRWIMGLMGNLPD